ncbi:MAG TPA: hypothetical protein VET27_00005, partial [Mycobacterium sp.]|nr:hypothetical protein [Mycobacterium sp.]
RPPVARFRVPRGAAGIGCIRTARLGFLFGSRMSMLEHIARRSGAKRHLVLEVFDHPASGD